MKILERYESGVEKLYITVFSCESGDVFAYVVHEESNKAADKNVVDLYGTPVAKERDFRRGNWLLGKDTGMNPETFFSY